MRVFGVLFYGVWVEGLGWQRSWEFGGLFCSLIGVLATS